MPGSQPGDRARQERRFALALLLAPLFIGFPLVWQGFNDPGSIAKRWDSWLIFVGLPWAAAAFLWFRPRRG